MPESMTTSSTLGGSGTRSKCSERVSRNSAAPAVPRLTTIWSMMPVGAPDELVLGPLPRHRQFHVIEPQVERGAQGARHAHLQRGARGQAAADRHGGLDAHVNAAQVEPALPERHGHALHVVEPRVRHGLAPQQELLHAVRLVDVRAPHPHVGVRARHKLHARPLGNHGRQDEPAVVVGVLTDQVHSTWRLGREGRSRAEQVSKGLHVSPLSPNGLCRGREGLAEDLAIRVGQRHAAQVRQRRRDVRRRHGARVLARLDALPEEDDRHLLIVAVQSSRATSRSPAAAVPSAATKNQ